eukprot:5302258-Amphidinium_carterae.1
MWTKQANRCKEKRLPNLVIVPSDVEPLLSKACGVRSICATLSARETQLVGAIPRSHDQLVLAHLPSWSNAWPILHLSCGWHDLRPVKEGHCAAD